MLTVARKADLALPEFIAFNRGQSLPWMRRWELPFALFHARLENTMAVLDCTINPINFHEQLGRLYPYVSYSHWNLVQNGQFTLSPGAPDGAFDRVFCINTLEHLLQSQRAALIEALARKLKPGGWLVLTCDYYFDSAWRDPVFLNSGLIRADHQEVFNGFNRVAPQELTELCAANGLVPLGNALETPREGDLTLYRQAASLCACQHRRVFVKSTRPALPRQENCISVTHLEYP